MAANFDRNGIRVEVGVVEDDHVIPYSWPHRMLVSLSSVVRHVILCSLTRNPPRAFYILNVRF